MNIITIGGKSYGVKKTKTQFLQTDIKKNCTKSVCAIANYISDGMTAYELLQLSDIKFLQLLIKRGSINSLCIHLLKDLHTAIARLYLKIIDNCSAKDPDLVNRLGLKFEDSSERDYPANYTDEVIRLKSISWNGYIPDSIKGFCPFEPIVRINQLLEYPIEQFCSPNIDIKIDTESSNLPQSWSYERGKNDDETLYNRTLAAIPILEIWETYYIKKCELLHKLISKINEY